MSRKNWSNLFLFLAAVSLMLGVLPSNPVPALAWIAIPVWVGLGTDFTTPHGLESPISNILAILCACSVRRYSCC